MSGCEMPVVINSGSGNQGHTVSLPVIGYAKAYHKSQGELGRDGMRETDRKILQIMTRC